MYVCVYVCVCERENEIKIERHTHTIPPYLDSLEVESMSGLRNTLQCECVSVCMRV
jgi:hypothetical protein